jgi:hypothetical protein
MERFRLDLAGFGKDEGNYRRGKFGARRLNPLISSHELFEC